MSFSLTQEVTQAQGEKRAPEQQECEQKTFQSKHNYKFVAENSKNVVVYFTFRPENQPDLEQSKIVFLLKKILQDNPLATPPRVYRAKFFLSFEERPDSNVLRDIYDVMKK